MAYRFSYADKKWMEQILPRCFAMLHANMNVIAPSGRSYDEDFTTWYEAVFPAMHKAQRQIVLMFEDDLPAGYFQYYVANGVFMMEEMQLARDYQGKGLFRALYRWLLPQLPEGILQVEAYAHKSNIKSQGILEHLGLSRCGENENGSSYHYRGEYATLYGHFFA